MASLYSMPINLSLLPRLLSAFAAAGEGDEVSGGLNLPQNWSVCFIPDSGSRISDTSRFKACHRNVSEVSELADTT